MKCRRLGRTGLDVGVIGFGGIPIQRLDEASAVAVVSRALDLGMNLIDTARAYTDSERKIGRAIAGRRDGLVLASKALSRDEAGMYAEVEQSLSDLGVTCIDLYQIHGLGSIDQLEQVLGPGGAYRALESHRREGRIRFIGVTGHERNTLAAALASDAFDTVQHPFNPIETEWLDAVVPLAKQRDVGLIGMKPVAGGALRNVAAALRFSLAQAMDAVIPGMDTLAQVEQNAAVGVALAAPSPAERDGLEQEKQLWSGAFCRRCGYCQPCSQGLNIPMLLLLQAYHERYDMADWARARLAGQKKKYADCAACGDCLERCPYGLDIPGMMARSAVPAR